MNTDDHLRFPIGRKELALNKKLDFDAGLQTLREAPSLFRAKVDGLSEEQLQAQYRPESWTVKQVVHHCADSHTIALMRLKRGLTEKRPTVMDYNEVGHALLSDYGLELSVALDQLELVHKRFVTIFENLTENQWQRTYYHIGMERDFTPADVLKLYDWHTRHHLGHLDLALRN